MKKTISIVLITLLLLSSLSFASEAMTAGEKLAALGLVKGDAQGNLLEDEALTRAQMMVMLARLNGVEKKAENFDSEMVFRDVLADSYYGPFIAYAYEQGWTKGTSEETFSPDAIVNQQMVATFLLRVLGYDVNWDQAIEEAYQLGIVDELSDGTFTRKNAFDMIYDAVNTKINNEDILLGEKLGIGEDILLVDAKALSNTKVEITFSAPLDSETVESAHFQITDTTNNAEDVVILDLAVNDSVVTLTTEAMKDIVYSVEVYNVTDIYGNSLDRGNSYLIFFGKNPANRVENMSIKRINETKIAVEFNENIDERALNENLYSIDGDLGQPEKVEVATPLDEEDYSVVEDYRKTVILTIPKTNAEQVYTLTVAKGLENIDGVETSEPLTENFIGDGIIAHLPMIKSVIALDHQTLKIHFDRDVTDETINGKIWNQKNNTILGPNILSIDATGNESIKDPEDFDLNDAAYAYESSEKGDVLIVRMNEEVFESSETTAMNKKFHLIAKSDYVYSQNGANILAFEANDQRVKNPIVEDVMMLNEETIAVYFNEPVQMKNKDEIKIYKAIEDITNNTLITTINKMTSKNGFVWTMSLEAPVQSSDVISDTAYFYLPDGAAKDITGTVDVLDANTLDSYQLLAFDLNYSEAKSIDDIFVEMPDNRTIEVTYPEAMKSSDVTKEKNYTLLGEDNNGEVSELETVDFKAFYSTYDKDSNITTLYLNEPITNARNMSDYYLAIDSLVENALETKKINDETTVNLEGLPSKKGLIIEFTSDTTEPNRPVLENAKVSDDRYTLTIRFNEDIAFLAANNAFHPSRSLTEALTVTEFLEAIEIKVQFESEEKISIVQSDDISSLSSIGPSNEKSLKVTLNKKIAVNSIGSVTTEGRARNKIFNRKSVFAKVNSAASRVNFGVAQPLYSDGQLPSFMLNKSHGIDSDGDGRLNQVSLVFDENMKLTQSIDTNNKAKTLITELVVDNGTGYIDLRETITDVTVRDNEVILNLEDSIIGTGTIRVSIDADTGDANGQLQDMSILKASDETAVTLPDTVAPILIKATAEIGSQAVRLRFSEQVSGGTAAIPENIKASDLNWTDISSDGAAFIKFTLSSKEKANHGVVVDNGIILNDLGKDTVSLIEDSIFDSSGNSGPSSKPVILNNN